MKNKLHLKLHIALWFLTAIVGHSFAQTTPPVALTVGSYNIRYDNENDRKDGNGWESRLPVISAIINYNDFDILGAQEVLHHQFEDLTGQLAAYNVVGIGRDDGKTQGEYAPIFFRKDRFEQLDWGVFWLSETPNEVSKGWDAALPRICTWVKLRHLKSGRSIAYFNVHLDHVGLIAREESCKLILQQISQIANGMPVILTGDFNVDQHNPMYTILQESDLVKDAYTTAKIKLALNGTFNAFDNNLYTESRIDHIFLSQDISVERYAVLTDSYRSPKVSPNDVKKGDFPSEL